MIRIAACIVLCSCLAPADDGGPPPKPPDAPPNGNPTRGGDQQMTGEFCVSPVTSSCAPDRIPVVCYRNGAQTKPAWCVSPTVEQMGANSTLYCCE